MATLISLTTFFLGSGGSRKLFLEKTRWERETERERERKREREGHRERERETERDRQHANNDNASPQSCDLNKFN